jgi:hypothetical protein
MSHLPFTLLLALLMSAATALRGNRSARDRVYHAVYLMLSCLIATVGGSWIMYLIHG